MDDFKDEISKEVLDSLTMEDLWNSPRLKKLVEEKYPRAYLSITEPMREFGLFDFIKGGTHPHIPIPVGFLFVG